MLKRIIFTVSNIIVGVAFLALALGVAGLLWWTGDHWCVGTMLGCMK